MKTPHTEITITGMISNSILKVLKQEYGSDLKIIDDDTPINIFETEWYKATQKNMKPGDYIRAYRGKMGWTQIELGERLGKIPKQHISNMERGIRPISLKMAQKLAILFNTTIDRFVISP